MEYVELRVFDDDREAGTVLQMLHAARINCHLRDEHIQCHDKHLSPVIGGLKLMVHHTEVKRAWELMEKAEAAWLRQIPCPVCHKHTLQAVIYTRDHRCHLSALARLVLNGQSVEINKIYQCSSCGYDFKDLRKR